ncbi:hypothetical protein ACP4OV_011506 [Aristida adscensionis]
MAAPVSPLDEPLVGPCKDKERHASCGDSYSDAKMEAQPLLLRRDDEGTSFSRSCLNLSNLISGVGMLSMPYALAQGGWLSLALFTLVGAVCYYTGELIARCMRADGDAIKSYSDIGEVAFGHRGRRAIGLVMYAELYLVAISFLILEGQNLDKLLPGTSVGLLGHRLHGKQLFTLAAAVIILPTTWLRDLSVLAYVSAAGLVASAALTTSLFWAGVAEHGFYGKGGDVLNLAGLPTSLSLFFVCFASHGVFPTVYSSMRNKRDFSKVVLVSFVLCSLNYALIAVLGYLIYGDGVHPLMTLNLPSGKVYTRIAILTTLITPLAKFPLVIQPITIAIEENLSLTARGGLIRAAKHGGGSVRGALLRLPHVVHWVLTQCHSGRLVPVPKLPQDL